VHRYKYDPVVLKSILFPGREGDRPPPKKRRRIDSAEKAESAMEVDFDNTASSLSYAKTRPVILETAKESYLLSPSIPGNGGGPHTYDIALILEAELEEEPVPEVNPAAPVLPVSPTASQSAQICAGPAKDALKTLSIPSGLDPANSGVHKSTLDDISSNFSEASTIPINPTVQPTLSPALPLPPTSLSSEHQQDGVANPPHVASEVLSSTVPKEAAVAELPQLAKALEPSSLPEILPSSRRASLVYGDGSKPLLLQALQRNLGDEMFQFLKDGVKVADDSSEDGVQTQWMVQVRRWKWGPVTS
jgi:hypothetical protein